MKSFFLLVVPLSFLLGCGPDTNDADQPIRVDEGLRPAWVDPNDPYTQYDINTIKFLDDVAASSQDVPGLTELVFVTLDQQEKKVSDYIQDQHVVVVVTRGNTDPICPYCSTQVARLIKRHSEIQNQNAEVLVVYPVQIQKEESVHGFLAEANRLLDTKDESPFPVLLDVELKGVSALGIQEDLSKPATYIVDRDGAVRFAYVGANRADRPSVDAILKELKAINASNSEAAGE